MSGFMERVEEMKKYKSFECGDMETIHIEVPHSLKIVSATYGVGSTKADVGAMLQELVVGNTTLHLEGGPHLHVGDPAPGKKKKLSVVYMDIVPPSDMQFTCNDLETIHIEVPNALRITSASYGAGSSTMDAREKLQALVAGNVLHLEGGPHVHLGDPSPGVRKQLVINYVNEPGASTPAPSPVPANPVPANPVPANPVPGIADITINDGPTTAPVGVPVYITSASHHLNLGSTPEGKVDTTDAKQGWQEWKLAPASGNHVYIESVAHGKALAVKGGSVSADSTRGAFQEWAVEGVGNGFRIRSIAEDAFLTSSSSRVVSCGAHTEHIWSIVPVQGGAEQNYRKDLSGQSFAGQNCHRRDFAHCNLSGCDLSNSNCLQANFQGACLAGANLSGAICKQANLSHCNLVAANLQNADLNQANLSSSDLSQSQCQNANLSQAQCRNVKVDGANLEGANLMHTTLHK